MNRPSKPRLPWLNSFEISEREHTRRAIHASRFKRLLPGLAQRLGLEPDHAHDVAERSFFLCATCFGPLPKPRAYRVDGELLGFLCGRCEAAIEGCGGRLERLRKHRRFTPERASNRRRLSRFIALHSPPTEATRDAGEDQISGGERETSHDADDECIA